MDIITRDDASSEVKRIRKAMRDGNISFWQLSLATNTPFTTVQNMLYGRQNVPREWLEKAKSAIEERKERAS